MISKINPLKSVGYLLMLFTLIVSDVSYSNNIKSHNNTLNYIDPKGVLYFNLDQADNSIIVAEMDLKQFVPIIFPLNLGATDISFNQNQIKIKGYLRPSIVINYSIDPNTKKIINAVYEQQIPDLEKIDPNKKYRVREPGDMSVMAAIVRDMDLEPIPDSGTVIINSESLSLDMINKLGESVELDSDKKFEDLTINNWYSHNVSLILAIRHEFYNMFEFHQNFKKNLLNKNERELERKQQDFNMVKALYFKYLQFYPEYDDLDLIIRAIELNDVDFIYMGLFNSLDKIDNLAFGLYNHTTCTPLGKAMIMNQYEMSKLLLEKGASVENVCGYGSSFSSALTVAELYKNRRIIRLINKHLKEIHAE